MLVSGAETLRGDVLDRLAGACEASGTGLVLAYRSLPPHVRERLGRGNAAVAFMRLGNADDARAASEQIGTEHRFVVAQLTDTVGSSVSDTAGQAYTSTVGTASSAALSRSAGQSSGQSGGRGRSWAGSSPFAPRTASAQRGDQLLGRRQRLGLADRGDQPGHLVGPADRAGGGREPRAGPGQPAVP